MEPDHYALLGVPRDAPAADVRAAYVRLMRTHHPDLRPGDLASAEISRRANDAWQVLRDPGRRSAYDRILALHGPGPADVPGIERPASAYGAAREEYRLRFQRASLRAGVGVFVAGLLLLALTAG